MEINEAMVTAIAGTSVMFATLMEALLKPFIKNVNERIQARGNRGLFPDEMHGLFRAGSVLLGIIFVMVNQDGMLSLTKVWWYRIPADWRIFDIIATGAIIGLNNKAIHDAVKFGKGTGAGLLAWLDRKANPTVDPPVEDPIPLE